MEELTAKLEDVGRDHAAVTQGARNVLAKYRDTNREDQMYERLRNTYQSLLKQLGDHDKEAEEIGGVISEERVKWMEAAGEFKDEVTAMLASMHSAQASQATMRTQETTRLPTPQRSSGGVPTPSVRSTPLPQPPTSATRGTPTRLQISPFMFESPTIERSETGDRAKRDRSGTTESRSAMDPSSSPKKARGFSGARATHGAGDGGDVGEDEVDELVDDGSEEEAGEFDANGKRKDGEELTNAIGYAVEECSNCTMRGDYCYAKKQVIPTPGRMHPPCTKCRQRRKGGCEGAYSEYAIPQRNEMA